MTRNVRREADHSPPSGADFKECVGAIRPLPNTPSWCGTYLLTYLIIPWYRILFEKLIVTQFVKNILSYGTRRYITVFTKARHWTLC
jgi:hypothetical protein